MSLIHAKDLPDHKISVLEFSDWSQGTHINRGMRMTRELLIEHVEQLRRTYRATHNNMRDAYHQRDLVPRFSNRWTFWDTIITADRVKLVEVGIALRQAREIQKKLLTALGEEA